MGPGESVPSPRTRDYLEYVRANAAPPTDNTPTPDLGYDTVSVHLMIPLMAVLREEAELRGATPEETATSILTGRLAMLKEGNCPACGCDHHGFD